MEEDLKRLAANPEDWDLRESVVRSFYDSGQHARASEILYETPWIPQDETSILFAASVFGSTHLAQAEKLLNQYIASNGTSPGIEALRSRLGLSTQRRQPIPPETRNSPRTPVPPREETKPTAKRQIEVVPAGPATTPRAKTPVPADPAPSSPDKDSLPHSDANLVPQESLLPQASAPVPEEEKKSPSVPTKSPERKEEESAPEAPPSDEPKPTASETSSKAKTEADPEHPDHEKHIIVSEGKAVQAAEKEDDRKEKIRAAITAVVIHIVLIIVFAFLAIAQPPAGPPQITASAPPAEATTLDATTLDRKKQKNTSAVETPLKAISSNSLSDFVLPDTLNMDANLALTAISDSDTAFGNSMSGFGKMSGIPSGMRSRCSISERMKRLRESGGDEAAEDAIEKGLQFLLSQQDAQTGAFGKEFTAGMTGLALLAYLGHCETPESAKYGDSVVRAATFLMQLSMENNGLLTNNTRGDHETYEHAIATYALCELYTMSKAGGREIPRLALILRKSVGLIVNAQSGEGGWPYGFTGEGYEDLSVSSWQIQALKAAYNTGLKIPGVEASLDKAVEDFIPRIQDSQGAFKYNPQDPSGRDSLSGAAILALQIWKGADSSAYYKGMRYLTTRYLNPTPGGNYYTPYYNTQAFFMAEGEQWDNYNTKFQPLLLKAQNSDGSWLGTGPRKDDKIMNTAWAILMLEVYYRYLPTSNKVKGLKLR